ncbi:MAG: sugar phosphate isomerase/epimerase [Candidatus Sphingomonas colombiensis]|nr:sugar phosphate isomerase/epimerase [Sphingomonas sp.]WEK44056.1 MAG: sugar phosphate isomerase/epimerase [Sphingomonas sp.]
MIDRRNILRLAGAATVAAAIGSGDVAIAAPRPGRPVIGVQLYMLRELLAKDAEATLAAIARIGIRHVEFAGYHDRTPAQWRALLKANDLTAIGAHSLYPDMRDEQIAAAIDFGGALGLEWLVAAVPRLPGLTLPFTEASFRAATHRITADDLKATAERFNRIGERVKAAGMRFAYHSHGFDFRRYDGRYGLDLILEQTDPALVALQLDIGNTIAAGIDPMPYLAPGGRTRLAHVKDWRAPYTPSLDDMPASAPAGEGSIKWRPIITALERARVPYAFIEQEGIDPAAALDLLKRNYRYLQGMRQ